MLHFENGGKPHCILVDVADLTSDCVVYCGSQSSRVSLGTLQNLVSNGVDAKTVITFEIGFTGKTPETLPTDVDDLSMLLTLCAGAADDFL